MTIAAFKHPTGPYNDFNFVLLVDGTTLGGFADATGLHGTTHGAGNGAGRGSQSRVREPPGPGVFDTVTLKRGLADAALLSEWRGRGRFGRQPATLALLDEHRRLAIVWHLSHAWVVQLVGPAPTADRDVVAVELLDLAHEGLTLAD